MKKPKIIIFVALSFILNLTHAQTVCILDSPQYANVTVSIVNDASYADLLVYEVSSASFASGNNGFWYIINNCQYAKKICFIDNASSADLKIFIVSSSSNAGWRNSSKKYLMY